MITAARGHDDVGGLHELLRLLDGALLDGLNQIVGAAVLLHDLHELVRQMIGALLRLRMRREDHGVTGLQREHAVAHRRRDGVRDRTHRGHDAHRLCDEHEVVLGVLADHAARLLALQAVPDHAGLALFLEDLVLVVADAGLVDGHARERLGVVVDVFRHVAHDRVDLLLREPLVDRLSFAGLGHELLYFVVGDDGAFRSAHLDLLPSIIQG
jgi:hypothetical protein